MASKRRSSERSLRYALVAAAAIRLALFASPRWSRTLAERVEVTTPVTSWKRLQEGAFLYDRGLDPYTGDIFSQSPLLLAVLACLPSHEAASALLFTALDLVGALLLVGLARRKRRRDRSEAQRTSTAPRVEPWLVGSLYLLSPFTILSCVGRSTIGINNLAVLASISYAASGIVLPSMLALAIAAHLTIQPILLAPPIVMLLARAQPGQSWPLPSLVLLAAVAGLASVSFYIVGSWSFLRGYAAMLLVNDLTPNVGLSWYLFIEMFDEFRLFFVGVFQLHVVSYVIPISIKLRSDPLFAAVILSGIIATFKPYTAVGDIGLFHALLALYPELIPHMRYPLFSLMLLVYAVALAPAFHYLWLYAGSGNANFFYASTLVMGLANGALTMDALWAWLRMGFLRDKDTSGDVVVVQS